MVWNVAYRDTCHIAITGTRGGLPPLFVACRYKFSGAIHANSGVYASEPWHGNCLY